MDNHDRPRGMLSKADRNFLANGGEDYSRQAAHERRTAIRERVTNGIQDFTVLNAYLDPEERNKIINVPPTIGPTYADTGLSDDMREGIENAVAFVYLALEGEIDGLPPHALPTVPSFKEALESAVSRAEFDRHAKAGLHSYADTELTVNVRKEHENWHAGTAAAKLARGNAECLSEAELRALVQSGAEFIDAWGARDAIASLIEAKREEMDPRTEVPEWFEGGAGSSDGELPERDEQLSERDRVEMIVRLDRMGYSIDEILDIVGSAGSHADEGDISTEGGR